jgi:hypothetical protein
VKLIRLALARNLARSLNHEGCLLDWTRIDLCLKLSDKQQQQREKTEHVVGRADHSDVQCFSGNGKSCPKIMPLLSYCMNGPWYFPKLHFLWGLWLCFF